MVISGKIFRIALKRLDITQARAAELIGVSRQTIVSWTSKSELDDKTCQIVKEKLGIDLYNLHLELNNEGFIPSNRSAISKESSNDSQEESDTPNQYLIPMYNFPSAASDIEIYNNPEDVKIIGHFNLPGARKDSFALPVYGHSMYPTLENGSWCVLRELYDTQEIVWGEIYYIEWGDYRMFKRLLQDESEEHVILWSDNQLDMVNDRPKYSPVKILKSKIRRLCLLTDIIKKPNY